MIIYDTTGPVDPAQGGAALKLAKIDLLQPATLFALQHEHELESLLILLRHSQRLQVVDLQVAPATKSKGRSTRRKHRA